MNTRGTVSALLGAVFMLGASPGMALDPTFQIAAKNIQRVPTSFKFQAAISQAKMPVGEAVFQTLIVNLKKGDQVMCSETFNDVQVRDSVLNLDIGKQMSCDMDAVMAEHSGLTFQVCIGGAENCLKPVELGTVPYAVKSNFAVQAQEAHTSDVSVQSHYAHRVTADRDLFESQNETLGAGYFDFYTEDTGTLATTLQMLDAITLSDTHRTEDLSVVGYTPVGTDGYVQWVPTHGATDGRILNICARNLDSDIPAMLDRLVFHSNLMTLRGDQEVFGNSITTGDVDIGGGLEVLGQVDFYDDANISENLHVMMESDLDGDVRGHSNLTIALESDLTGDVRAHNNLNVMLESDLDGDVRAHSNLTVDLESDLTGAVRAHNTLTVTDHTQLNSTLTTEGHTQLNTTLTTEGHTQLNTTLTTEGHTQLNSTLTTEGHTQLNNTLETVGTTHLLDTLTVEGATQLNNTLDVAADQASTFGGILTVADTKASTLGGTLLVKDTSILTGDVAALSNMAVTANTTVGGTLGVTGTSTLTGDVAALSNMAVTANTTVGGTLGVTGTSTLTGDVAALSNMAVTANTTVGGTLGVTGISTLTGDVSAGSDMAVTGNTTVGGTMGVTGTSTLTGDVDAQSTINVGGVATFNSDVNVALGQNFTNAGHTQLDHTLTVASGKTTTLGGPVTVTDGQTTTLNGDVNIGNDAVADTLNINGVCDVQGTFTTHGALTALGPVNIGQADQGVTTMSIYHNVNFLGDVTIPSDSISYNFGDQEIVYSQNIVNGEVKTADIGDGEVMTVDIDDNAVTYAKIADDAIGNAEMLDNAIGNAEMLDNAIGNAEMLDNAIGNAEMLDNAIGSDEVILDSLTQDDLAPDSVAYSEMSDDAIGNAEMLDNAIGNAEMLDNAIGSDEVILDSLTQNDLAPDSVAYSEMSDNAIGNAEMRDDAIGNAEMRDDAIGNAEMLDDAITDRELADNAVLTDHIEDLQVTDEKIVGMSASKLNGTLSDTLAANWTADHLADDSVGAAQLAKDAVVGGEGGDILDESITNSDISPSAAIAGSKIASLATSQLTGTISGGQVAALAITDSNISPSAAIAGSKIESESITTTQIDDQSLTYDDLGPGSVRSSELDLQYFDIGTAYDDHDDADIFTGTTTGRLDLMDTDSNLESNRVLRLRGGRYGGEIYLYNKDLTPSMRVALMLDSDDHGRLLLYNTFEQLTVDLGVSDTQDSGYLRLSTRYNSGSISTAVPRQTVNLSSGTNGGYLELRDNSTSASYNDVRVTAGINNNAISGAVRSGYIDLNSGYSDARNMVWIGARTNGTHYTGGSAKFYDYGGVAQAGIYVDFDDNGIVWGDSKSFVVDHPLQPDKVIVYTSLEGSTVDMYHRGTYQLEEGYAEIPLPEHFTVLADEEGMSATLTPRSAESRGLAIVAIKPDRLVVQELMKGKGSYMFDYNVIAVRARHRDHEVIQDWAKYRQPETSDDRPDHVSDDPIVSDVDVEAPMDSKEQMLEE